MALARPRIAEVNLEQAVAIYFSTHEVGERFGVTDNVLERHNGSILVNFRCLTDDPQGPPGGCVEAAVRRAERPDRGRGEGGEGGAATQTDRAAHHALGRE